MKKAPKDENRLNFQRQLKIIRWVVLVLVLVMIGVIIGTFIFSMNDECSGRGTFEGWRTYNMKSSVKSRITKINFHDGEYVKAGEVMLELDSSDLQEAIAGVEANIKELQAALALKKAALDLEASDLRDNIERVRANIAELTAELYAAQTSLLLLKHNPLPEEYRHTEIALEERRVMLETSRQKLEAYKNLKDRGAMAQLNFLDHQTDVTRNEKELEKLKKDFAIVSGGLAQKITAEAEAKLKLLATKIENRKKELALLEKKMHEYRFARSQAEIALLETRITNRKLELEQLKSKMSEYRFVAPEDGIIASIPTKPGTYVEPGMSVVQFAAGQERKFIAYVDEVEIFKIEEKQSVRIASSQYSTYEYGYFQGEVMYIGELPVERAGRVYYPVFIRVTHEPQPLRLGSSGEAKISTGRDRIIRTIMGTNRKRKSTPLK